MMSVISARVKQTMGNGTIIGWIGCPAIAAVDCGCEKLRAISELSRVGDSTKYGSTAGLVPRFLKEARRILALARLGKDPAAEKTAKRGEITVAELCKLYLEEGTATEKPSTMATATSIQS